MSWRAFCSWPGATRNRPTTAATGSGPRRKPAATGTLEQLARKAGCDPNVQTDAAELRQANCTTDEGRYVLTTFATDRGQREWINEAKDYGGAYLVGRQWVAVGDPDVVAALRGRLGGTVETASPHHSGDSGGGGARTGTPVTARADHAGSRGPRAPRQRQRRPSLMHRTMVLISRSSKTLMKSPWSVIGLCSCSGKESTAKPGPGGTS